MFGVWWEVNFMFCRWITSRRGIRLFDMLSGFRSRTVLSLAEGRRWASLLLMFIHWLLCMILNECIGSLQTEIPKPNDFQQPGERYRSWAPDRYIVTMDRNSINMNYTLQLKLTSLTCRQERFVRRWAEALAHPKVSYELRNIWVTYLSKVSFLFSLLCFHFIRLIDHNN